MADPADTIVPLAGILVIFGLPLTYALVNRVLAHQERLEMIKHGVVPPPDPKWAKRMRKEGWYDPNAYGMRQPGAAPPGYDSCGFYGDPNRQLRKGISLVCIGIALTVGLSFISPGRPGPWLLGGLIPMFVGIAQVVIAMLSGAGGAANIFGGFDGPRPGMPQPPPGQQAQAPGQPFGAPRDVTPGGYGGWRPGPTTGLEKPPSPPDVR